LKLWRGLKFSNTCIVKVLYYAFNPYKLSNFFALSFCLESEHRSFVLYSAVGSVLYLFGGSNYPESEECLDGLYAYDIGKTYVSLEYIIRNEDDDNDDDVKQVPAFQPYCKSQQR